MAFHSPTQTIHLNTEAPTKPAFGAPCNGCGVCCAAETCPWAVLLFRQRRGPCPALIWNEETKRYFCGLLDDPAQYVCWLPRRWNAAAIRFFTRRIAAGTSCDCSAEVVSPAASVSSDKRQS